MSLEWYVPIVSLLYLILMIISSGYMVNILDISFIGLILIGIFLPPIWLIMALIALFYAASGKDVKRVRKIEVVKKKRSPKK